MNYYQQQEKSQDAEDSMKQDVDLRRRKIRRVNLAERVVAQIEEGAAVGNR